MFTILAVGIFILFDVITGVLKAVATTGLNSYAMRQGLYHKLSEMVAVVGSYLLEIGCAYIKLGVELPFSGVVSVYVCTMELISILENLAVVNPDLAKLFDPYLEKLKGGKRDEKGH